MKFFFFFIRPLLIALLFFSFSCCSAQKDAYLFINKFFALAQKLSGDYGIPPSVMLGISMLESDNGKSSNCKLLSNYFGVKGKNHIKKKHTAYKQYASAEDSFEDFCKIVSRKKFYPKLKYSPHYKLWLTNLNNSNYASAKGVWISRVQTIIGHFKLYLYDHIDKFIKTEDEL